ncbi:hypothetical protein KY285_009108 [Solanum tuberosum]|nr:hypothetical protein KY285_009108 [Solanum tuberosum]
MPTFFDVMVHLAIHLANEAKLGGPVQFRWMYYIERFLQTLKGYVRNNYRVEGSIAEGDIARECITLFSRYLSDMETKKNRPDTKENNRNVAKRHKEELPLWFEKKPIMMQNMHISSDTETADVGTIPPPKKKRKGRGKTTGLSTQKKRKGNDNGKLKVIIPSDRTVPVGPGAKDFITELSVKVLHNARHDVKNWKGVPDLAKNRIVSYMLDTFQLTDIQHNRDTILQTTKNLYRYRRSRHHDHFKKFATKEESLQNIPTDVNEAEWKFLVDYSSYDDFKKMSERNKNNKAKQEVNHICSKKTFQAVSYEARDTNTGKEPNFQKLWEITHMKPNGQWVTHAAAEVNNGLPASIFNIITTSTNSNETSSASLMNNNWVALSEKRSSEMRLPKLSSQDSKKTIPKELVDANNQVFEKIHEELKARSMLHTAEETKKRLLSEKSSLEEKIVELEKKKSSEDEHA